MPKQLWNDNHGTNLEHEHKPIRRNLGITLVTNIHQTCWGCGHIFLGQSWSPSHISIGGSLVVVCLTACLFVWMDRWFEGLILLPFFVSMLEE